MNSRDVIFAILAACGLSACSDNKDLTQDYVERLNNILETSSASVPGKYPSFPSPDALTIEKADKDISIREFLKLRQCKLHVSIAKRNSSLGKVAGLSQRLKNDLEILANGPPCISRLDDLTLAKKLKHYLQLKQSELPKTLWQATLGGNEFRKFWHIKAHAKSYPQQLPAANTVENIKQLNQTIGPILNGQYQLTDAEFMQLESALGKIRFGDGGQLLSAYVDLSTSLEQANQAVRARLQRPLCIQLRSTPDPQPNQRARHLRNIVSKFFVPNVQTQAVLLQQRYTQLMPELLSLEEKLVQHATPSYQEWITERNAAFRKGQESTKQHALLLKQLFQQCGLRVGNQPT